MRAPATLIALVIASLACFQDVGALWQRNSPCSQLVDRYEKEHGAHVTPTNVTDAFIFFLHVPRTAGKTYAQCFLKSALPPTQRCAPSYDLLRLNISQEGCRYLVSHDDYSLTSQLPDNMLVVTQLRDPVTRVLSAYEFAIEVAARRVKVDDATFFDSSKNTTFVNTLNVFPWSGLVPWFRTDIRGRMAALDAEADAQNTTRPRLWTEHIDRRSNRTYYWSKTLNQSVWKLPTANTTLDPYDNPLAMPLAEWLETPVAQELVHEGATFQVLGITNYSMWEGATALRRCFFEDKSARERLTATAKARLRSMLHVGLTEDLDRSVASLAAGLGYNLSGTSYRSTGRAMFSYDAPGFDTEQEVTYNATQDNPKGVMTTLTVQKAREQLIKLNREVTPIANQLKKLEPQLQRLVDKEAEWLEEEDKRKEEAEGEEEAAAVAAVGGVKAALQVVTAAPGRLVQWIKSFKGWPPAAAATADTETQHVQHDEEPLEENIDSPWAAEIEALDARVYRMQQRRDVLQADIDALLAIPEVKGPDTAQGRAKLIMPESDFVDTMALGASYRRCSHNATTRAANKRRGAFKDLVTPWHESFGFSSAARRALPAALVQRIRELNAADQEIWEMGKALLEEALEEQRAAGTLQELPPSDAPPPPGKGKAETEAAAATPKDQEEATTKAENGDDAASVGSAETETSSDAESHDEL